MKKIGIIGAMEIEVEQLKKDMVLETIVERAGMKFFQGTLCRMPVVIVQSGVGKVNAAICTQILIDIFQIDAVINTGVAGSLDAKINIGDLVISQDVLHHDMDVTSLGYAPGQIPGMQVLAFPADLELAELAEDICRKTNPEIGVFRGRVVSGDQFISGKEKKQWIVQTFGGCCTEMEGAPIAQAAYCNQIPFLILRAISDKADDSAVMDYPTFEKKAAQHSVRLVEGLLSALADQI